MADWDPFIASNAPTICPTSAESTGAQAICDGNILSSIWAVANTAVYIPFVVYQSFMVVKLSVWNGTVVAGNFDLGVYDDQKNRLVSSGSTAQAGTSVIQTVDVTDVLLLPGQYYMACVANGISGRYFKYTSVASVQGSWGVLSQTSAFPLPTTANWVRNTMEAPIMMVHQRTTN